ncbi:CBS domain-containing protein [Streptomyces sp. NPDC006743]|uniref:CBS domain-containing protein n=1 Tax=Streptomyces sp. NPDC006743 TaxID=3154480 RepID=UPI0034518971
MTTARDIMTGGAECVGAGETVLDATRRMKDLGVGALPVCGTDNKLKGVLTMVAQADVARSLPDPQVGDLLQALSSD